MNPTSLQSEVIAANAAMYRTLAARYDRCWTVLGHDLDPALNRDLEKIASSFSGERPFRCLDCGAGTGALALNMLSRGWEVTAVDVSPEMLEAMARKIAVKGFTAELINRPIEEFLSQPGPLYHLIGFHSVLHHIYDYSSVINLAIERLAPGGFLFTDVDPVIAAHPWATGIFDFLDTGIAKILHEPSDLIPGGIRRLRKLTGNADPKFGRKVASVGDIAEFHARSGVNDWTIIQILKAKGLELVEHARYPLARTRATSFVNRILKLRQEFKIIARRSTNPPVC